ncbi:DUF5047 domain-containing protein [Streptomyces bauhiniae]|uniref:DUF5047 domain-containing protein n=1 Tax=Streptomyces bauhiniae TaxID=2340725 RepID=UPI00339F9D13
MYPVTDRFLTRLTESHRPITRVQLILTDGRVLDLDHTGGSVTVDRAQAIRRTCSITQADPSLIPRTAVDQLAMFGSRLRVSRGVDYGDGSQELVPLGVFRLDDVDGDVTDGPVTLQGKDLSACIADDKFTQPYTATGTVITAITALVQRSLPDAAVIARITDTPIGSRAYDRQADPWAACQEIAAAAGAEIYCDAEGDFIIATLPDIAITLPAWSIEAAEGGAYIKATRGMKADKVCNGILASGENAADGVPPVSYLAVDSDPGSPTYWGGPFGRRPDFYSSSTLTTTAACQQAATLKLALSRTPNASGDISSLPNPALEPGDIVRVTHPDGSRELHQIAAFTVPLDIGGDFPITTISAREDS